MTPPNVKLAESLKVLKELQEQHGVAIHTNELTRTHRERLIKNHFLQEVAKGWYISKNPSVKEGDSTAWYTSFWAFCKRYLELKYKQEYCISAEQSLMIHGGNTIIPQQLIVKATTGSNTIIELLHGTSIYIMKSSVSDIDQEEAPYIGIRIMKKEEALIHMSPSTYITNPVEVKLVLASIKDPSLLLRNLLKGSHSIKAGRLIGAFQHINYSKVAVEIQRTMEAAEYVLSIKDPFVKSTPKLFSNLSTNPYANRINLLWKTMRNEVIQHFPPPPAPIDKNTYMERIETLFVTDAYHSLSIENYVVSAKLIEDIRSGNWNLNIKENIAQKGAMAARGYWQAFQAVKQSIQKLYEGENAGKIYDLDHGEWYRQLFNPSVSAGLIQAVDLAGYRNQQVYIANFRHTPFNKDAVREAMPALIELLINEKEASVRSILGHFIFVFIHPYMDGNGRMGRFLMNMMLASGGYPWTVIPVEKRAIYMQALEQASVENNIVPFTKLIAELVQKTIDGNPEATL